MAQTTSSVALFYTLAACLKVATVTAVKTITLGQVRYSEKIPLMGCRICQL